MKKIIFLLVLVQFAIVLILSKNLDNPYLWTDEAIQFYISKGDYIDKDVPPNTFPLNAEPKNVTEVMHQNHVTVDPGGYGIILHYWSKISNGHYWLRGLSFIFLLSTMLLFFLLSLKWTKSYVIAICSGMLPTISPMLVHYGFEVRPYGMEYLGIVLNVYFLHKAINSIEKKWFFLFILSLCFSMCSRYSSLITSAVFFIVFFIHILQKNRNFLKSFIYALPGGVIIFLLAVVIYLTQTRFQTPKVIPPEHIMEKLLYYNKGFLFKPSFIVYNLPFLFFTLAYIFINKKSEEISKKYSTFFLLIIAQNLIFILLSFVGKHPWDISSRWSISLHVLSFISIIALVSMLTDYCINKYNIKIRQIELLALPFSVIVLVLHINVNFLGYREEGTIIESLKGMHSFNGKKVLIDKWEEHTVRYLYEYGSLKTAKTSSFYPKSFELKDLKNINCIDEINPSTYQVIVIPNSYINKEKCVKNTSSSWEQNKIEDKIWVSN